MAAAAQSETERAAPVFGAYSPTLHVLVEAYETERAGLYVVCCVKHQRSVEVRHFSNAVDQARQPGEWCERCMGKIEQGKEAERRALSERDRAERAARALEALRARLMGRL